MIKTLDEKETMEKIKAMLLKQLKKDVFKSFETNSIKPLIAESIVYLMVKDKLGITTGMPELAQLNIQLYLNQYDRLLEKVVKSIIYDQEVKG
jgi:hypothetical protein